MVTAITEPPHLETDLKTLNLSTVAAQWRPLAEQAARQRQAPADYLALLVHLEVTGRRERRIQRRIHEARFPMLKTLDAFSFEAQPELDRDAVLQVFDCSFVTEAANVVYVGGVGTGKTHLSIALGMACCQHNYRVRFVTAAELVTLLVEAQQQGRLARKLDQLARFDLIIVDELGYVPLDKAGADLLFGFISQRYERRSLVVTTNLPFARWSEVFLDPTAAAAVIDRIVHHSTVLQTSGSSYQAGGRETKPGADGRRKGANALMSPDRARTTMRWGDAPSGAPRSHPLTTSAPIRAQRGDRREPVRYKRRPPPAAGFGRLRERLQTDAPCAPDCGFSRHMSRCEPRASTRPRDPSNLETVSREGGHGLTN